MSGDVLAVVWPGDLSGGAANRHEGATIIATQGPTLPSAMAEALRISDCGFAMFPPRFNAAFITTGVAMARRWPESGIVIDDARLARRDRRAIRTDGLRYLDPTEFCPIVIERNLAIMCLGTDAVAAAGPRWRWALARKAARQGLLTVDSFSTSRLVRKSAPIVEPAILDAVISAETGYKADRRILVIGRIEASVSLYFDGLPDKTRSRLRFYEAEALATAPDALATADAAIVVRDLERCHDTGILKRLAALNIPTLYFVDDNPLALAAEDRHWRFYTADRLRALLTPFAGVIASTQALVEAFSPFHRNVRLFAPVLDASKVQPLHDQDALRVAITGGAFRKSASARDIMPAILAISAEDPGVTLMAPEDFGFAASGSFQFEPMPRLASFAQFLQAWQRAASSVLVHPRSATKNDEYKTPNALLVALYLGTVLIVQDDEPAYAGLGEADGVLKAGTATGWEAALRRTRDPAVRRRLYEALSRTCSTLFAPGDHGPILDRLSGTCAPLSTEQVLARRTVLARLKLTDPWLVCYARRSARRLAATLQR